MIIETKVSALKNELNYVRGVATGKSKIAAHAHILVETGDQEIRLTATEGTATIITRVPATVSTPGSIAIKSDKLIGVISTLPEEATVLLTAQGNDRTLLKCERYQSTLAGIAPRDFPSTPVLKGNVPGFTIEASRLRTMIARTIMAITEEESRYVLSCAKLIIGKHKDTLVTTNGHCLALIEANGMNRAIDEDIHVLIPHKTVIELQKLTRSHKGDIHFQVDDNHISFEIGNRQMVSGLQTGQFPSYEMIIPRENGLSAIAHVGTLNRALARVALMTSGREGGVSFHFEPGTLTLQARNAEEGEATDLVEVQYTGAPFDIRLNSTYVREFLNALGSDDAIEFRMKDAQTQVLTRPIGETGIDFTYIIAPMRL